MNRRWICAGAGAVLLAGGLGAVSAQAAAGHGTDRAQQAPQIGDEGPLPETTALQVTAPGPPRFVYGSDGRTHVNYDLVITNTFTAGATLRSLTVSSGRTTLLRLTGGTLAEHTHGFFPETPAAARIPAAATRVTLVDVVLPRWAGRHAPRQLTNRIDYTIPPNAKFRAVIASTTVHGPVLRTVRRPPVVIAPPLRGRYWIDPNGCCADPTSPHRSAVLAVNGTYVTPEMFAIDWIQAVHGALFRGDGKQLSDWFGFGRPVYAVANGVVVRAINNRPETPPFTLPAAVQKPGDFGGNEVVERIGPGLYAVYEHFQTHSVMVRRGQRLRTGQPIGKVGSTGNSTSPHLHFGIQDSPDAISSNSLPFEINHYTVRDVSPASTLDHIIITGPPRLERRSEPLIDTAETFTSPAG